MGQMRMSTLSRRLILRCQIQLSTFSRRFILRFHGWEEKNLLLPNIIWSESAENMEFTDTCKMRQTQTRTCSQKREREREP